VGPILLTQKSLQTDYIHLIQNLPGRFHKFTRMRQTPTKGKTVRMSIQ